jgi:transcriptional regulator with XRE-family HTH domain
VRQRERVIDTQSSSAPGRLSGALLRTLREAAGLNQTQAAAASGVRQDDISRMERGKAPIRADRVDALLGVYASGENRPGLTPGRIADLVEQARALERDRADRRVVLQAGNPVNFALRTRRAEDTAKLIRSYQPVMILGVLQTREYARVVLSEDVNVDPGEVERVIADRAERWGSLADPKRQWILIHLESALRSPLHSYDLQAAQVQRLLAASELPNVRLGVIPLDVVAPYQVSLTGFHLYDDRELVIGTDVGTALLDDVEHIEAYAERFAVLESLAVFGEEARVLLRNIVDAYAAKGV